MTKIVFNDYSNKDIRVEEFSTFKDALKCAEMLSVIIKKYSNWTKPEYSSDVMRHMDIYADLYNEGSITINISKE